MTLNNPPLFDAAIAGIAASNGAWLTDPIAADYSGSANAAAAIASEIDTSIPPITPSISISQRELMQSIAKSVMTGRTPQSTSPNDYASIAQAIGGIFTEYSLKLQNTDTGSGEAFSYTAIGGGSDDMPSVTQHLANVPVELTAPSQIVFSTPPNGSGTYAPTNSTPNLFGNDRLTTAPGTNLLFKMTYRFGFYGAANRTPGSNLASAPATETVVNNVVVVYPWANTPQVGYLVWIEQMVGAVAEVSGSSFTISALGEATIGTTDVTASGLYGAGGTLNGKTLILAVDGNATQTLTLSGSGNTANLSAFIAAIVAQWPTVFQVGVGGPSSNKLLISSASIVIGVGTANTTLGLTAGVPTYASILLDRPIVWQNAIGDAVGWSATYPKDIYLNFEGANVQGYANQPFEFTLSQRVIIDSLNYTLTQSEIPFLGGMAVIGFDIGCRDCVLQNSSIIFPQNPVFVGSNGLYCQSNEHTLVWNTTVRNAQVQGYAFLDCYACAGIFTSTSDCAWGFSAQRFDNTTFGSLDCSFLSCNDAGSNVGEWIWGSVRTKSLGCSSTKNPIYGLLIDRNCDANYFTNCSYTNCDTGVYVDVTASGSSLAQLNTDGCRIGITAAGSLTVVQWRHHSSRTEATAKCAFISGTGTNILKDIDLESLSGGNGIDVQALGTLIIDGGHISVGSLGYCLQVETACNVNVSHIVFTGAIGINTPAGTVTIGPGCDFSAASTPIIVSGTGKVIFNQTGGVLSYSGSQRFMVLNECYNTTIEVASGGPSLIGLPGIPGLQFTIFNGTVANFTAVSTAGSDPGVVIAAGKTAIVRVNSTNHCVRVTPDT